MAIVLVLSSWVFILLSFLLIGRCALLLDSPDWTLPAAAVSFVGAMMLHWAGQRLRKSS